MMDNPTISVPLKTDKYGTVRVGGTRVTLSVVIARYQQGNTAEQIQQGFPKLKLADIHTVISYYLNNKDEVDAYLRQQEEAAQEHREQMEREHPEMFVLQNKLREHLTKPEK